MVPNIGDKVKVKTHNGNKLCIIDNITDKTIHFKNSKFGLCVNKERVNFMSKSWFNCNFYYVSFN